MTKLSIGCIACAFLWQLGCATAGPQGRTPCDTPLSADRQRPSVEDVVAAVKDVAPGVHACALEHGLDRLIITEFEIDGATGRVHVQGVSAADPSARLCIARAFAKACFAPFHAETFRVRYPFRPPP